METKDLVKDLSDKVAKAEKLHTLEVMSICLEAIGRKEVTIKYEGEDKTHIYIGGKYFQTLPGSQWARIVNLVVDVTAKAYTQGANDYAKDLLEKLK